MLPLGSDTIRNRRLRGPGFVQGAHDSGRCQAVRPRLAPSGSLGSSLRVRRELSLLRFPEDGFVSVGERRPAFGLVSAVITGTESPCL